MAIPVGTILNYSANAAPESLDEAWLLCDGSAQAIPEAARKTLDGGATYPALYSVIGGVFGTDGQSTFNLPDMRGRFVRATDFSPIVGVAGRDPDALARTAMATGGNSGNQVGSVQPDAIGPHYHTLENTWGAGSDSDRVRATVKNDGYGGPVIGQTLAQGGPESRPLNAALSFLILAESPSQRLPLGAVVSYGGQTDPVDSTSDGDVWMICDGRPLKRADYPDFYNQFRVVLGPTNGDVWFNIPDFRGRFLRGQSGASGRDPDINSRTPMFYGSPGQGQVGSLQASAVGKHSHGLAGQQGIQHYGRSDLQVMGAPAESTPAGQTDAEGTDIGSETRPKNAYLHQIIRVR